jgi:dienelactone hydrolase
MSGEDLAPSIVKPEFLFEISDKTVIYLGTFNELGTNILSALGISNTASPELGSEGYVLKTLKLSNRQILFVAAPSRMGVLYGVYDLLHRLGVRWYAPGQIHEKVPRRAPEPFPVFDIKESPGFSTRGFHAWENRADRDFLLWMARNRLNYWCVEQEDKPFLHKLGILLVGGAHVLTSYYLGPSLEYPYDHSRFTGDESKPADPYPISPEYRGDSDNNGRLSYFEAHPEWYGLREGKRSSHIEGDFGDNFCTSNQEAMTEWTKNAVRDLADGRYKDADIMNAWTLDGGNWCQCDNCKALGTPTDRNILFVHAYARAIKQAQAEKRINRPIKLLFLAYADVIEPPTRPLPEDFDYDMCIATYFPIRRCYVHRFDAPNCSVNGDYRKKLEGWFSDADRRYRGQVCIGEYYNVSGFKCLPLCLMHTMFYDIPYYYAIGARHFHYMHVTTGNWGNKALTNWQMARQLWDPATDYIALWKDYFGGRYGPAQDLMRQFYEYLELMLANISQLKYGLARRLEKDEDELFPDPHLRYEKTTSDSDDGPDMVEILEHSRRCRQLIDEAAAMNLPDQAAQCIAEDERNFRYAEWTIFFYDALCQTKFHLDAGRVSEARASLDQAKSIARLLQSDTISTKLSSSHANAADALEASFAAPALSKFEEKIRLANKDIKPAAPVYPDKSKLLVYLDTDGQEHPIKSATDWEIRRHHILINMQKVTGALPEQSRRIPLDLRELEEEDLGDVLRKKITFNAEPGSPVYAYLLIPKKLAARAPAALCLHQTTPRGKEEPAGLSQNSKLPYALELARRGYVTLAPDYPGYGEDKSDPYALGYESATMKGIWNHIRAVDVLESLPEVDAGRIAAVGHSLGGHNAIFVALFEPRIKAVVTSCGFTSFKKYYGGDLTGWSHKGYMPKIASVFGKNPDRMPFDFSELLAALAPRSVFINAPLKDDNFEVTGVDDCLRAASEVYALLGAKDALAIIHPDMGHSFPPDIREQAYRFLDKFFSRRH